MTRIPNSLHHRIAILFAIALGFGGISPAIEPGPYRTKGQVALGEFAEYERGNLDLDQLLLEYREYGLPLPPKYSSPKYLTF